jgi:hypothetical protein
VLRIRIRSDPDLFGRILSIFSSQIFSYKKLAEIYLGQDSDPEIFKSQIRIRNTEYNRGFVKQILPVTNKTENTGIGLSGQEKQSIQFINKLGYLYVVATPSS